MVLGRPFELYRGNYSDSGGSTRWFHGVHCERCGVFGHSVWITAGPLSPWTVAAIASELAAVSAELQEAVQPKKAGPASGAWGASGPCF